MLILTPSLGSIVGISLIALTLLLLLSTGARGGIINLFRAIGYLIQAVALFFLRHWGVLLILLITGLIFVFGIVFLSAIGVISLGTVFGMREIAILLVVMLTLAFFLSFFRLTRPINNWLLIPLIVTSSVILIAGGLWWMFGTISPELHDSYARLSRNKMKEAAFSADKASVHSEPEQAVWGIVIQDGSTYNAAGQAVEEDGLKKGTRVKICDLRGTPATENSEGLICVMLPNKYGDYVDGDRRWVPSRKISWEVSKTEATAAAEAKEKATAGVNGKQLVDTVRVGQPPFPRFLSGYLPPGEYQITFTPASAADGATLCIVLPDGKEELRKIINGHITVAEGEKGSAIQTLSVAVARIKV